MEQAQHAFESIAPQTLEEALALLNRRDAELAALRSAQQEWVHAVSHDLRAPLRHVLAFNPLIAELLRSSNPGADDLEEALSFLQTMDQSAQRMAAMFDGLLQMSRVDRHVLQLKSVELLPVLHSVQQRLQANAAGRQIEWCLPAVAPAVQADPYLLELALTAALSNAIKFTRSVSQARIQVDVRDQMQSRDCWIAITDNGVGFDQSRAGKLFGVFQRMHREADFEGVGTGLVLVRNICRRHGGEAEIEAQPNAGCQLQMSWPKA